MKITILYDNDAWDSRLAPDWGFAALIEAHGHRILFDTGAKGELLEGNMHRLGISPEAVEEVFISHNHWDHTGGLGRILAKKPVRVYVPDTIKEVPDAPETVPVGPAAKIHKHIHSTGTLKRIEQAMCIESDGKVVVVVGCSHPGVSEILEAASGIGRVSALIGGLHGFSDFPVLEPLELICATHCTRYKQPILERFPETAMPGGAGRVIEL
jgi:7,8-dihydropterin-6-yl-methyl-4-(beta-D-ribofuranosyl)aminobenzene 5'-phosphate synthase